MKNIYIIKVLKKIFYVLILFLILIVIMILIWKNIMYKPINIGSEDSVEKIKIILIKNAEGKSFELNIIEKNDIDNLINILTNIKAKKILNGGGGDTDFDIYIEIEYNTNYSGNKLGYCAIHGNQILLSEGGKYAYQMSEKDSEILLKYILKLNDES